MQVYVLKKEMKKQNKKKTMKTKRCYEAERKYSARESRSFLFGPQRCVHVLESIRKYFLCVRAYFTNRVQNVLSSYLSCVMGSKWLNSYCFIG